MNTQSTTETVFIDDDDRYSRLRLISWWDQELLRRSRVMVVGAGAIGNEVLKNLALVGVGELLVVDSDRVDTSNLTRSLLFRRRDAGRPKAEVAAEALADLNPDTATTGLFADVRELGLGKFLDVDVVIGCLDNREARLWVNRQCWKVSRPWIDGGIQELNGVVKVFAPPASACYECAMTENDYRLINLRYSCPLLSREDLQAGKVPTAPTIAGIVGGMQVQEALKLLHQLPVAAGQAHIFNGLANRFYSTAFQRREECLSHETYEGIETHSFATRDHSPLDLFHRVATHHGKGPWTLHLDRDVLVQLHCDACGTSEPIWRPSLRVRHREAACPNCGQVRRPETLSVVDADSAAATRSLDELGVPADDVVKVCSESRTVYVRLGG